MKKLENNNPSTIQRLGYLMMELGLLKKPKKYNRFYGNKMIEHYSFELVITIDKMINN